MENVLQNEKKSFYKQKKTRMDTDYLESFEFYQWRW